MRFHDRNNTLVENCYFGTGHGASIGSLCGAWLHNITFRNIVFDGTTAGSRIKTHPKCAGTVTDVTYENLVMKDVKTPIEISMFYDGDGPLPKTTMQIHYITYRNITATGSGADTSVSFDCDPESPCHSIALQDIDIEYGDMECKNAFGKNLSHDVKPKSCVH